MRQRRSGYAREPNDRYETPPWVTEALLPHLAADLKIWEPAAGSGNMVSVLRGAGHEVHSSDVDEDFLNAGANGCTAVVTNPPYDRAREFIEHALAVTEPHQGLVAMLLRVDYDSAKTRMHLFADCRSFAKKLVLVRRIVWFAPAKKSPSYNHAWYLWDHRHHGAPALAYGPRGSSIPGKQRKENNP